MEGLIVARKTACFKVELFKYTHRQPAAQIQGSESGLSTSLPERPLFQRGLDGL